MGLFYSVIAIVALLPRRSEIVIFAYFTYAAIIGFTRPLSPSIQYGVLAANASLFVLYAFLIRYDIRVLREWLPLPSMLLGYKEMGWFALPHADTHLEDSWVRLDRLVLNDWGGRALIESLGPVIPVLLEISYTLVYTIGTFSLIMLYRHRARHRMDEFLFCLLLGTFVAYALFPFFPSEPPRAVFPGQDLPNIQPVFRRFNYWLLGNWGIHTSVFPSAHVSSAYAAAFALRRILPQQPAIHGGVLILSTLIAISTVYGRYHYLVDALAGLAIAIGAAFVSRIAFRNP